MSFKKSAFLLPTYASACTQYQSISASKSTTSCHFTPRNHCRKYATHDDTPRQRPSDRSQPYTSSPDADPHSWPSASPPRTVPTPYQILHVKPKASYTKKTARFYELVKLYHPDRHEHPETILYSSIPTHVRLERYRLVVSAHAILSDPEKRRAYDLYGAGWAGAKSLFPPPDFTMSPEAREACMHNATWQDWENWYDRFNPPKPGDPPRQPQAPIFVSNAAFISLVGILAALAGVGQATRAHESGANYVFMVDAASDKAKNDKARMQEAKDGWTREKRIDYFVKERDAKEYADERAKKSFLDRDVSDLSDVNDRGEDFTRRYR